MVQNEAPNHTVDIFLTTAFPRVLEALVILIDDLQNTGQVETIDDLRAILVKLSLVCREYRP